ncbi:MAG: riboflavin biosynthesis protein RibF, partial [Paludibacter sp.]|nr:riboflavin biosynthesis protein RibF [Paludibacter sp.]
MKIITAQNIDFLKDGCVATVGFFDGVHRGHRFLIENLKAKAAASGLKSLVVTFAIHPRKVLQSDFQPLLLSSLHEKLEQLSSTGVDACVLLEFSPEMAQLTAQQFLKTVLFDRYQVRALLVGHDHRFGRNRAEGFDDYVRYGEQMGMKVIQAERFYTAEFPHISSSDVRKALQEGDVQKAANILTYPYGFGGHVVNGFRVGRKIGFPTANIKPDEPDKLIPALGVYEVLVNIDSERHRGMMNIGHRPTLENG